MFALAMQYVLGGGLTVSKSGIFYLLPCAIDVPLPQARGFSEIFRNRPSCSSGDGDVFIGHHTAINPQFTTDGLYDSNGKSISPSKVVDYAVSCGYTWCDRISITSSIPWCHLRGNGNAIFGVHYVCWMHSYQVDSKIVFLRQMAFSKSEFEAGIVVYEGTYQSGKLYYPTGYYASTYHIAGDGWSAPRPDVFSSAASSVLAHQIPSGWKGGEFGKGGGYHSFFFSGSLSATGGEPSYNEGEYQFWASKTYQYPFISTMVDQSGFTEAFYTAADKLPILEQNTIANLIEGITTLRSFRSGFKKFSSIKQLVQEAWLAWRYSYNTTVSDIRECSSAISRLCDLANKPSLSTYGYATRGSAQYYCCITLSTKGLIPETLSEFSRWSNTELSLVNVWDMIPYSFVVDWFVGIGSVFDAIDDWLEVEELPIENIWYSFYNSYEDSATRHEIYFRWRGCEPHLPYVSCSSVSSKTIFMRVADALSLFF